LASESFGTTDGAISLLFQATWQALVAGSRSTRAKPPVVVAPFSVASGDE
jgi:hypothetical protein